MLPSKPAEDETTGDDEHEPDQQVADRDDERRGFGDGPDECRIRPVDRVVAEDDRAEQHQDDADERDRVTATGDALFRLNPPNHFAPHPLPPCKVQQLAPELSSAGPPHCALQRRICGQEDFSLARSRTNPDQPEKDPHACRAHRSFGTKAAFRRQKYVTEQVIMKSRFCQELAKKGLKKLELLAKKC